MNLDDAIKHCEEIAMDKTNLAQTLWDSKEKARCEECAEEHNQLAQWLIELKILKTEQQSSGSEKPNKWIPVSERLPEEETAVLISCEDLYLHRLNPCIGWRNGQYWNTFTANGCKQILYPTAWMSLPKPYLPDTNIGNMSENPTSSKPEISSFYGLRSYVRERSE